MSDSDFPFLFLTVGEDGSVELWHTDRAYALFHWRDAQKCLEALASLEGDLVEDAYLPGKPPPPPPTPERVRQIIGLAERIEAGETGLDDEEGRP